MTTEHKRAPTLQLADDLAVPLRTVTEKLAWLGRTGSGKTYGAMKMAELMLEAGAQIGAIDPIGVWRGLRVAGAPHGRAFDVVIFGGLEGDLPIDPGAGALIADLICDRGFSFVLDVSQLLAKEQQQFVRTFADQFFQRKKRAPAAVHLFLEECQEFIPEQPAGLEALTLGVMQRLWKLGRNFGIGGSLISQRPQEIAKKALNMSGTLFAFQMTGPQERKAIRSWVAHHGVAADIEGILQKLEIGQPHVESPMFLEISKTIRIRRRLSADLSSTPEVGGRAAARKALTPIDVENLKTQMAATIAKAQEDDPALLRKARDDAKAQVKRLEQQLERATREPQIHTSGPALTPAELELLGRLTEKAEIARAGIAATAQSITDLLSDGLIAAVRNAGQEWAKRAGRDLEDVAELLAGKRLAQLIEKLSSLRASWAAAPKAEVRSSKLEAPRSTATIAEKIDYLRRTDPINGHAGDLTPAQAKILSWLDWLAAIDIAEPTKAQIALCCDVPPTSGGFRGNLATLADQGLINYPRPGLVGLTAAGRALAPPIAMPHQAGPLQEALKARVGPARAAILQALILFLER